MILLVAILRWLTRKERSEAEAEAEALVQRHAQAVEYFSRWLGHFQGTEFELVDDVEFSAMVARHHAAAKALVAHRWWRFSKDQVDRMRRDAEILELVSSRIPNPERLPTYLSIHLDAARGPSTPQRAATRVFSIVEAGLPTRLRNEEIGDALEYINAFGRSPLAIYTKLLSTLFWLGVNALRELASAALGRATK
jgi:hypothetical protein